MAGRPAPHHPVFHRLRVAAVDRLTDDAVAVTFDVPPALREDYRFRAGQHVNVRLVLDGGVEVRRSYSICSPATSGELRVAVKRIPAGTFSAYAVQRLAAGDEVDVMTPTGWFTPDLDPARAGRYVAVAAGSGITPVVSIVATVLEVEQRSVFTLLYGNRTSRSVMFLEELADLKDRYPERFLLLHVLSREAQESPLGTGRLDRQRLHLVLDRLVPPDTVDDWYLCGPRGMVDTARELLAERGVGPAHVHSELFHVDGAPGGGGVAEPRLSAAAPVETAPAGAEAVSEVSVVLDGRRTTLTLARSAEPVLDAVLRERGDAPFACRSGVCGTCRARLVEGRVRMDRNYALEESDVAGGYVLTCQAHPLTPRVVLDYDA